MSGFKEQLVAMVVLQWTEKEISGIEKDLAGIDKHLEALNTEATDFEHNITAAIHKLGDLQKQYRYDESEVLLIDSQIEKSHEKLRAVKTNKEYQSTLKEIDDLKEKRSAIEDQMLENLEQIENADAFVAEQKADLEEVKIEVAIKQEDIRKKGAAQQQALERWRLERDRILLKIDTKMRQLYEKVKKQNSGLAMAAIREGICQVCRLNIPPQQFNELKSMHSMRMCPHCQRIMYPKTVEDEIEFRF